MDEMEAGVEDGREQIGLRRAIKSFGKQLRKGTIEDIIPSFVSVLYYVQHWYSDYGLRPIRADCQCVTQ